MASVYLTSSNSVANDTRTDNFSQLRRSALTGGALIHHIVATPEEADIILFSNSLFVNQADIRTHFLAKKFAEKIFVYSTTDRQVPFSRKCMHVQKGGGTYHPICAQDFISKSWTTTGSGHLP